MNTLRKTHIGPFNVALMIFCVVASGAFGVEEMVPITGPGLTLLILCILPIVWALPNSLIVAEASSLLPKAGGFYAWAKEAFGDFWGFQTGIWTMLSEYICSSTYVVLAASYICQLFNFSNDYAIFVKIIVVVLFTIVNIAGLKSSEKTSVIMSYVVIVTFIVLVIIGLCNWKTNPFVPFTNPDLDIFESAGGGFAIAIWMYCGWDAIAAISEELIDGKTISKGLKIAVPLISLSYLLPVLASLASLPEGSWINWTIGSGVNGDSVGFASVISILFGSAGMSIFLCVAALSNCAIYSTYMTSSSRVCFAMADDNLFPKILSNIDRSGRSPYVGIFSIAVVSFALSVIDFAKLVEIEIIFDLCMYMILPFIFLKLRKKYPINARDKQLFNVGKNKFSIGFCVVSPIVVSIFIILTQDVNMIIYYMIALLVCVALYLLIKFIYGGNSHVEGKYFGYKIHKKDIKNSAIFISLVVVIGLFAYLCGGL